MSGHKNMKTVSAALQALLDSQQFYKCKLFTFTLITGQVYYWTDADIDVVAYSQVYSSTGPSISGAQFHMQRGLQVDSFTLKVLASATDLIAGVSWSTAARSGALDGATVKIDKAFLPAWGSPAESVNFFTGTVSGTADGEQITELTVVSDDEKLNGVIPKLTCQPGCVRTLYDAGCTLSRVNFQSTGTVTGITSRAKFATGLSAADGYFALGAITFTSGANGSVRRSVKSYVGGVIELSNPLVFDLALGDTFLVYAGCDHTLGANGCAKFNNTPNFKATPFVPKPETMV